MNIDGIVDVSKNSVIKKRNNDVTYLSLKKINDDIITEIYNDNNNFLKPYNFVMNKDNKSYIRSNNKKINHKFYFKNIFCS